MQAPIDHIMLHSRREEKGIPKNDVDPSQITVLVASEASSSLAREARLRDWKVRDSSKLDVPYCPTWWLEEIKAAQGTTRDSLITR